MAEAASSAGSKPDLSAAVSTGTRFNEVTLGRTTLCHHVFGPITSRPAPTSKPTTSQNLGCRQGNQSTGSVRLGRSRNGMFKPWSTRSSATGLVAGNRAKTGAGSILSVRQTLRARARTNVKSGSSSNRSASSASSLAWVTFIDAAKAAMCKPWRWRSARIKPPAPRLALAATGASAVADESSLIESFAFIQRSLWGLRETAQQLVAKLALAHQIAQLVFDA